MFQLLELLTEILRLQQDLQWHPSARHVMATSWARGSCGWMTGSVEIACFSKMNLIQLLFIHWFIICLVYLKYMNSLYFLFHSIWYFQNLSISSHLFVRFVYLSLLCLPLVFSHARLPALSNASCVCCLPWSCRWWPSWCYHVSPSWRLHNEVPGIGFWVSREGYDGNPRNAYIILIHLIPFIDPKIFWMYNAHSHLRTIYGKRERYLNGYISTCRFYIVVLKDIFCVSGSWILSTGLAIMAGVDASS